MKSIQVTEPFLPPLEEYVEYLEEIWNRNVLTNKGPLCLELEGQLKAYHQIDMPGYSVANGGLGLQIIIKALGIKGEGNHHSFFLCGNSIMPSLGGL